MKTRIRNQVSLKKNFESELHYVKVFELLKIVIPNYKNVYGNFAKYYEAAVKIDDFDDCLYHFIAGPGYVIKVKEIKNGIWMTREPKGVCYIYEPKGKLARDLDREKEPFLCRQVTLLTRQYPISIPERKNPTTPIYLK